MKEIWKDIEGYEGLYQVSNFGRVRSLDRVVVRKNGWKQIIKGQMLKPFPLHEYMQISLRKEGKPHQYRLHRIVATAFIPNPDNLPEINHKDENKANNCVDNLEWCDRLYNLAYGTRSQRQALSQGHHVYQYYMNGVFVKDYPSITEASRQTKINRVSIANACRGFDSMGRRFTTAGGYLWKTIS